MADYTVKNLKEDVEDMAPKWDMAPDLESRFARRALELEKAGVSYFKMAPDFRFETGHLHTEQEEIYICVGGGVRVRVDDEVVELKEWDAIRVPPGVMHTFGGGPGGGELIAFGAPNTDDGDVEMVQEWWTD
jgi:mannose-6-phosphate isomerase-like protein (cupin superfamily)